MMFPVCTLSADGGKYSTTIGNGFCTLSIGFFLVILVYDHSYWAYIPVVGQKKKKKNLLQGLQNSLFRHVLQEKAQKLQLKLGDL
jgi:hypothetical protein